MPLVLYHHPFTRAANVVWMLEEIGIPYELRFVDLARAEQKQPAFLLKNPMGKIPVLLDGEVVVTEESAIALYLGDRYAYGRLAPRVDDPARATYLRWSVFAPIVIEPAVMAKAEGWKVPEMNAGWGTYAAMIDAVESAVAERAYVLGEAFSLADTMLGGMVQHLVSANQMERRPAIVAYAERIAARPAFERARAKNHAVAADRGLRG